MEKYERTEIIITEFDVEDIITTSSPKEEEYEIIIPGGSAMPVI